MQISFGAKIPISTCNIYDKKDNKFIKATLYEIDCKDKSDIEYFKNIKDNWEYREQIIIDAKDKHKKLLNKENNYWNKYNTHDCLLFRDNNLYSIEAPNNDVVCICETEQYNEDTDIAFIESPKREQYKFAGQTMLASIAKFLLKENGSLTIKSPKYEAEPFYQNVCNFENIDFGYELYPENAEEFIQRVEEKTKGEIVKFS